MRKEMPHVSYTRWRAASESFREKRCRTRARSVDARRLPQPAEDQVIFSSREQDRSVPFGDQGDTLPLFDGGLFSNGGNRLRATRLSRDASARDWTCIAFRRAGR